MIRISQLKLPVGHTAEELYMKAARLLRIPRKKILSLDIVRRSVDARNKPALFFVYTIDILTEDEKRILSGNRSANIQPAKKWNYRFPVPGSRKMHHPPVVIGSGPAGLFCAWMLAVNGYCPLILERGDEVGKRHGKVEEFWRTGRLDPECNVQFGEGGAGTCSDGKLNTGVKDGAGRNRKVLEIFIEAGAPEEILYDARPHLGTDLLTDIVRNMRKRIEEAGGTFLFRTKAEDLLIESGRITGVRTADGREFCSENVVLAIGHSARDTFSMLAAKPVIMQAKPFAVGVRIEHPQELIDLNQYGGPAPAETGPAFYRLARTVSNGRGVYSFCMCPGGYVVNASSEEGHLAVNGMSFRKRDGKNANSAIVVSVGPEDFMPFHEEGTSSVLDGLRFQRMLEKKAYELGEGAVPVQRFADFRANRKGGIGQILPSCRGDSACANVREIFPSVLSASLEEGIIFFDRMISGFAADDVLLSGVESRTSSPIRILRNEELQSSLAGLYPCGEGAGYAGGITSAAMDGIRVAEKIASQYSPLR